MRPARLLIVMQAGRKPPPFAPQTGLPAITSLPVSAGKQKKADAKESEWVGINIPIRNILHQSHNRVHLHPVFQYTILLPRVLLSVIPRKQLLRSHSDRILLL